MTLLPTSIFMISDSANFAASDSRRSCSRGRGRLTMSFSHQVQLTLAHVALGHGSAAHHSPLAMQEPCDALSPV